MRLPTILMSTTIACVLCGIGCSPNRHTPTLHAPAKPVWATAVVKDDHGYYADLVVAGVTQRMRWIKPGTFVMGSPQSEKDAAVAAGAKPEWVALEVQHEVTLTRGYWLADSECSQSLWRAITINNPAKFTDDANRPVEQVSWDDVQGFLASLNGRVLDLNARLPTEAEWEYACRAGTTGAFSFGGTITPDQVNYNGNYPYGGAAKGLDREKTMAARRLPPNAWGLYEMHGNVWEWCTDWYGDYASGSQRDPTGPLSGSFRVQRGGSWYHSAWYCRSAYRDWGTPDYRYDCVGFRLAAQATP